MVSDEVDKLQQGRNAGKPFAMGPVRKKYPVYFALVLDSARYGCQQFQWRRRAIPQAVKSAARVYGHPDFDQRTIKGTDEIDVPRSSHDLCRLCRVEIGAKLLAGDLSTGGRFDGQDALGGNAIPLIDRWPGYTQQFSEFCGTANELSGSGHGFDF